MQERPRKDLFGDCSPKLKWGGQQGLIWHFEPLGFGGKSGSSPSRPQALQSAGLGALAESPGSLELKSQNTSDWEGRDELSALHNGRNEPTDTEKASTPPSSRWGTAGGGYYSGKVDVVICPCGMPPPSPGSLKATTTCNSSHTSRSPAGGTGSRIRRFGQHSRQTQKPPIQI